MAKIIEHNFISRRNRAGRDLLAVSFDRAMEELEEKKILLGELVTQARLFLSREGLNPEDFVLSRSYVRDYLAASLDEGDGGEGGAELVYLSREENRILALCQFAVPREDEVRITYQIYALDHVQEGNRRWKIYHFLMQSWIDDGEDCFDLERVLREIGQV